MRKRVFVYILIFLLVSYFFGMLISQQVKIGEKEEEIEKLKAEITATVNESERLKEEIANAESRETIERIAREELGLIYPDERKFVDSNG